MDVREGREWELAITVSSSSSMISEPFVVTLAAYSLIGHSNSCPRQMKLYEGLVDASFTDEFPRERGKWVGQVFPILVET
jgi:hypothetical protein